MKNNNVEVVNFLKEELARIEDMLYSLGEIEDVSISLETLNNMIQSAFEDIRLHLEKGHLITAKEIAEFGAEKEWI